MKIKITDLADANFLKELAGVLNRGNEAKIKKERDKVVLVEEKRDVKIKIHIDD